jgi:hypothetical protein
MRNPFTEDRHYVTSNEEAISTARNEFGFLEQPATQSYEVGSDRVDLSQLPTDAVATPIAMEVNLFQKEVDPSTVVQSNALQFNGYRLQVFAAPCPNRAKVSVVATELRSVVEETIEEEASMLWKRQRRLADFSVFVAAYSD